MAFVLKDGQGTLFKNDKGGNDARPDYRGELMISGTKWSIAGWLKDGKNGKWMSLSAKVAEQPESPRLGGAVDDDIPF